MIASIGIQDQYRFGGQEIRNSSLGQAEQLITNIDEKYSRVDIEAGAFGISIDLGYALMALGPVMAIVMHLTYEDNLWRLPISRIL